MKSRAFPEPGRAPQDEHILPPPPDRSAEGWTERAEKAQEARALGRQLRKGKRLLFSSRQHLVR